jgi:hypothetical protein
MPLNAEKQEKDESEDVPESVRAGSFELALL